MRNICLLTIVLLSVFLLSACGGPKPLKKQHITDDGGNVSKYAKLSPERVKEIRETFIGRSFVFKEDWYEYALIDSDPVGGFSDPKPLTKFPKHIEKRGHRVKMASAGNLAKIVGIRIYGDGLTFICDVENGNQVYLTIINYRQWTVFFGSRNKRNPSPRDKLKDKRITVEWIDRNLTYYTVEWVDDIPATAATDLALPEPPTQPSLTPLSTAGTPASVPIIGRLQVQAEPPVVRNNQTLNLLLKYSVEGADQGSVAVVETRTLLLDGQVLPNYPKVTNESRISGEYSTNFQQLIPSRARAGEYLYRGEVCIADDCVSRTRKFSVSP